MLLGEVKINRLERCYTSRHQVAVLLEDLKRPGVRNLEKLYCFGLAWCDGALPQVTIRVAAAFFSSEDRDA